MGGRPVWLASVSMTDTRSGSLVPNARWTWDDWDFARVVVAAALDGAGDLACQRDFRMNVTLCRHRALTAAEVAALPGWWHAAPASHLAGGPIEVLHETIPGAASCRPCAAPRKWWIDRADPDLWVPLDCGACPSCLARSATEGAAA